MDNSINNLNNINSYTNTKTSNTNNNESTSHANTSNTDFSELLSEVSSPTESEKLKEDIDKLLEEVNEKLKPVNKEISYTLHDKVNRYIISVKNRDTGDLIREYPAKEQLDVYAKILENAGLLFDQLG